MGQAFVYFSTWAAANAVIVPIILLERVQQRFVETYG
jgi:hypothetical protein